MANLPTACRPVCEEAHNQSKVSLERCSRPECVLQCICGYEKGNPSSLKSFASLLKGNESYYSKIDWTSSGRRCRERRVPQRLSNYHLENVSAVSPRPVSEDPKLKNKSPRASPSENSSPQTLPATQQQTDEKITTPSSPNAEVSTKMTPSRKVAKKRTHPIKRFANVTKSKVTAEETVKTQEPVNKMAWIMHQLRGERFDILVEEEKSRAVDDRVDLNVQKGQTLQLVSWNRFHKIYQSGRIHIRFLSRRAGHVILVVRPDEIVDNSRDIQTMKGDVNAPEIAKKLLQQFISPEESSRYAVLFCDGVKWELMDFLATDQQPKEDSNVNKRNLPDLVGPPKVNQKDEQYQDMAVATLTAESDLPEADGADKMETTKFVDDKFSPDDSYSGSDDEEVVGSGQNETRAEEEKASGSKQTVSPNNLIQRPLSNRRVSYQVITAILIYLIRVTRHFETFFFSETKRTFAKALARSRCPIGSP